MTVPFILSLVLAGITVCALPYYCVLTYRGKSNVTLWYKMGLASLFVLAGLLALCAAPEKHSYMFFLFAAFAMSFAGDYILGKYDRMKMFVIGSVTFAVAHAFFITSFSLAVQSRLWDYSWFNGAEIGFFAAIYALMLLIMLWRKPLFHKLFIPMFIYYAVVLLMATKAFGVALRLGSEAPALWMLPIGGLLFVASDYTLGLMRFKVLPKTVVIKTFCTASYFVAQMLIALASFFLFGAAEKII